MKKLIWVLVPVLIVALTGFFGFEYLSYFSSPVLRELPVYKSREVYFTGGWTDGTEYGKFIYGNVSEDDLKSSEFFKEITDSDAKKLLIVTENFESFVNNIGIEDVMKAYDFDKSLISSGDYYYIKCNENFFDDEKVSDLYFYTLYYFDMESQTLYYFYNDI